MRSRKFLIVAALLLIAVASGVRAAWARAAGAQPLNAGTVTVTDSAIVPPTVTILAGGSVVWTNRGDRLHKIVAARDAFKAFALTAGHSHLLPFPRPGVYPYTVDAVTKGVVVVIARSAYVPPPTGAAPSSGPENCGHPKIYHYDIELAVHRDETRTITPPSDNPGNPVHRIFDWQAKWLRAPMSVELCRGVLRIFLPAGTHTSYGYNEGLPAAESTVKLSWDDRYELTDGTRGDARVPFCSFTDLSGSPATLAFDGGRFGFFFHATRIKPPEYPIAKYCDPYRAKAGGAKPGPATVGSDLPPFHTINGLAWTLSETLMNLSVPDVSRAPMPFPISALARGKGFDFRTGPLQTELRTPGISEAVSDWGTVTLTPVRP